MLPEVSVIIAVYNCALYVSQAIESVLAQEYPSLEIIILNDGSTDATSKILHTYRKQPFIKLIGQEHHGQGWAKNRLIKESRGKYIVLFDSDDIMLAGRIKKQVDVLDKHPSFGACYGKAKIVDRYLRPKRDQLYGSEFGVLIENAWDIIQTPLLPATLMFRRNLVIKIGSFNKELDYSTDTDFMLRLAENTKLFFLNEPLILYRLRKESASHHKEMQEEELFVRSMAIKRRYGMKVQF